MSPINIRSYMYNFFTVGNASNVGCINPALVAENQFTNPVNCSLSNKEDAP